MSADRTSIAKMIDHTLLKADASAEQIEKLCAEAQEFSFHSVCVNGYWVSACKRHLDGSGVKIAVVCGFPLGANESSVKAFEAAKAVEQGAHEIDMVVQAGLLLDGRYREAEDDIRQVVKAAEGALVKVILETGLLTDEQKRTGCRISEQAGAHYVKTSTGFGPGGATAEDIRLMRASVSDSLGVKASGGIRDLQTALKMIEAGATRIGTSSGVAIVKGVSSEADY